MIYTKKAKIVTGFPVSLDVSSNGINETILYCQKDVVVKNEDVIAKVYKSEFNVRFDIIDELDIKPSKAKDDLMKYVDVLDGQAVPKGKVLAHRSSLTTENLIKAPFDGIVTIDMSSSDIGIILKSIPVEIELKSLVDGKVINATKEKVVIETNVLRMFPAFIEGNSVFGRLKMLDDIEALNNEYAGCVIYYHGLVTSELVNKALAVNALGVLGLSCSHTLLSLTPEKFAIAALEGFGSIQVPFYDKIKQSEGLFAYIDVEKNELMMGTKLTIQDLKGIYLKQPSLNDIVQVYDNAAYACAGKIQEEEKDIFRILVNDAKEIKANKLNIIGILN